MQLIKNSTLLENGAEQYAILTSLGHSAGTYLVMGLQSLKPPGTEVLRL